MTNTSTMTDMEALELSIKHWETNAAALEPDDASVSSSDCALCQKYKDITCDGCPIKDFTGQDQCLGTPYYDARVALLDWQEVGGYGYKANWNAAAQAELDFLMDLREKMEWGW